MPLRELGAASEMRYIFNSMPRENVIRGIRERENYKAKLPPIKNKDIDMER